MLAIILLVEKLFSAYFIVCLIYCLLSWFPDAYNTTFGKWIVRLAEPYMGKFQKLPMQFGGIDFSPWLALIVLNLAKIGFTNIALNFV